MRASGPRPRPGVILGLAAGLALIFWPPGTEGAPPGRPAPPKLRVGVSVALTGPDARWGVPIRHGVELGVEDVNRQGGAGGHTLEALPRDSAASGSDTLSRQRAAAANYERFVADRTVIAAIGPQTSSEGRAIAAFLSRADLATVTPSATTFDITDPELRTIFRPGGRTVYFRTVGTDAAQGDAMARFAHGRLGIGRVVVVHDASRLGDRTIETFGRRAAALGITVVAARLLNWIEQDYRDELREIAALKPDALYVAVRYGVGVKLARQIPEILPSVHLLGTEVLYNAAFPIQARTSGAEGWYVPNVAPDPAGSPPAAAWAGRFRSRFGSEPSGYALSAYTALMVIADAVSRVAKRGQPVTRNRVRDAIEATRLPDALPGPVSFDRNGDLERPPVTIYQVRGRSFRYVETVFPRDVKAGGGVRR